MKQLNTASIVGYFPPTVKSENLQKALLFIDEWLNSLAEKNPPIIFSGDINQPKMNGFCEEKILEILENEKKTSQGKISQRPSKS